MSENLFWPIGYNAEYWADYYWPVEVGGGPPAVTPDFKIYKKIVGSAQWR